MYRGAYRNGRRNGRGSREDAATRERYDGKWVAGERTGRGVCTYPAGHRYEGQVCCTPSSFFPLSCFEQR